MSTEGDYLSISEMAELHGLSRQTLLYYDRIDLFKPSYIGTNGYRYYNTYQIPFLREICFLRAVGIKLEDIREHVKSRNVTTAISLLKEHGLTIDRKISKLIKTRQYILQKLNRYNDVLISQDQIYKPIVQYIPERPVLFFPFTAPISKQQLHLGVMKGWETLFKHGMLPARGWGTLILSENINTKNIFEGAGVFIDVPHKDVLNDKIITFRAGEYVCMYKYGMPYDQEHLFYLIRWIEENNYRIVGNIVDECLLDTTFYENSNDVDFCQILIPVEKI